MLNAQDLLFKTKVDLAKASYLFAMDFLRVQDAAGSLDEASVATVNRWLVESAR